MKERRTIEYVHEGRLVAEVEVSSIETDSERSPYYSIQRCEKTGGRARGPAPRRPRGRGPSRARVRADAGGSGVAETIRAGCSYTAYQLDPKQ